ncbi:2'-5' RNA ligase family protein [Natronosalvus amylolyticus]|uniref:2'-5' RNA ligase family protein n=1 Tax=Natronosalvus amylolyticus TaxID=2961994 RepID=UPI0020C964BF|nr:2'-5' RNA ligase family protein [Natronosalvus amylolyticus]
MYSVTVPVPGRVRALAGELYPDLVAFDTVREDHTCLLKRLGEAEHGHAHLQQRTHRALEGAPAVEAQITGIDYFEDPPLGTAPVVYLAVESPGLESIHQTLSETFGPVDGLEGDAYVPHVTLARGGDLERARTLSERDIDPVTWTVSELAFYDGGYRLPISRISLPA